MKKWIASLLALALMLTLLPTSVLAFDQYAVYDGQNGCRLSSWRFAKSDNVWLMTDVPFAAYCDGRVWESTIAHPNILGQSVIPQFRFEGDRVTFNGTDITSGVTAVELLAENNVVVYGAGTKAEYQVSVLEENSGLPTVLIDTDGIGIPDKVNYVDTAITILGADVYGGADLYAAVGGIKLRGNSTMGYDKKPYRIKFDKKQDVLGLGKAKSWVLLANYLDPARMRNDIAYSFGSRLSQMTAETTGFEVYVPRTRPVEVYLNGVYQGLYDMGDHIQVDSLRIAIDESGDETDDNGNQLYPQGNVGYYLEVENVDRVLGEYESEGAPYVVVRNTGGYNYNNMYVQVKTPEIASNTQLNYIASYLQNVNNLILAQNSSVWNYADMDTFVDWYLINEVFKNTDSHFLSSVKMFKDKDGKLCMGPVWDFDIGACAVSYGDIDDPTGWRTREPETCAWYENLFEMPEFVARVNERWADLREAGIVDGIFEDIDDLTVFLEDAALRDYSRWFDSYVNAVAETSWLSVPSWQLNSDDWEMQVHAYRNFMRGRVAWLDEQFGYAAPSGSTLSGEVAILGEAEYRETLMAGDMAIEPYGAFVSYQWYANGVAISGETGSTFTPGKEWIGSTITLKVTGKWGYSGTLTSAPVVLNFGEKMTATSQVPSLVSKTHNTVVVSERTGYDISIDGGKTWQTSGTFTGLRPNTLYRVVYRHTVNIDSCQPGLAGKPLRVITDANPNPFLLGDVNQDGGIDMRDAFAVYTAAAGGAITEDLIANADMNSDGVLDMRDAFSLYKIPAGG